MLLMVIAVVCVFVSVTAFSPPLPPTGTKFQLKDVGATVAEAKHRAACDTVIPTTARTAALLNDKCFAVDAGRRLAIGEDNPRMVARKNANRLHI